MAIEMDIVADFASDTKPLIAAGEIAITRTGTGINGARFARLLTTSPSEVEPDAHSQRRESVVYSFVLADDSRLENSKAGAESR